ncbi:hypothetical protein MHBO_001440 [Bonamia ostreae]|uniref:Uncharacterized protein n=1 Tax=Bonamia ostreae TaxID=126728 RepID=A0ABV2AJH4_9EUKA
MVFSHLSLVVFIRLVSSYGKAWQYGPPIESKLYEQRCLNLSKRMCTFDDLSDFFTEQKNLCEHAWIYPFYKTDSAYNVNFNYPGNNCGDYNVINSDNYKDAELASWCCESSYYKMAFSPKLAI